MTPTEQTFDLARRRPGNRERALRRILRARVGDCDSMGVMDATRECLDEIRAEARAALCPAKGGRP